MIEEGIVPNISRRHVGRLLTEATLKPQQTEYWGRQLADVFTIALERDGLFMDLEGSIATISSRHSDSFPSCLR